MGEKFLFLYNSRNLLWDDFKFHQDKGRQEMLQRTEGSSVAVNTSVSIYEMKPAVLGKNKVNKAEDTDSKRHRYLEELRIKHWTGQRDG